MCKPLKEYLAVVREYKDTIVMFIGIAACVFVYCDFRALAATQAETAAKTAEILRFNPRTRESATAPSAAIQRVERVSIHALVRVRRYRGFLEIVEERFQSTHS